MTGPRFLALRHPPPLAPGLCAGRFPVPVMPPEEALPLVLGRSHINPAPPTVITSPQPRCRDLAIRLAQHLGVPCSTDDRLRELDFGHWEGMSWDALYAARRVAFEAWAKDPVNQRPEGGESGRELEDRVRGFLAHPREPGALIVTHAGVVRAFWVIVLGWTWQRALLAQVPYLDPIAFDTEGVRTPTESAALGGAMRWNPCPV